MSGNPQDRLRVLDDFYGIGGQSDAAARLCAPFAEDAAR